jgi:hypothetical protein
LNPAEWEDFLEGRRFGAYTACMKAEDFAARNDAEVVEVRDCNPLPGAGEQGFTVKVRTRGTVGESVVPGTETKHATAKAKAVVKPRCIFDEPEPDPEETGKPDPDEDKDEKPILGLSCDGVPWDIDPKHPNLPSAADLFTVRLAD